MIAVEHIIVLLAHLIGVDIVAADLLAGDVAGTSIHVNFHIVVALVIYHRVLIDGSPEA